MHPERESNPQIRGTLADAETGETIILVKNVRRLQATCQIRLLAIKAFVCGQELVLRVPGDCRFEEPLSDLIRASGRIRRENLP